MTDLRTGLVEAMARAYSSEDEPDEMIIRWSEEALDAALGFLTDNAEAWARESSALRMGQTVSKADSVWTRHLIAALSDGRDTGEKEN